jgi:hypothetical protein
MNRRHFGLSIATAIFLTRQLREAIAQDASQSSSSRRYGCGAAHA